MEKELCGVILIDKHKGVTSHDYSLPCVKGDSPVRGNVVFDKRVPRREEGAGPRKWWKDCIR